MNQRLINKQAPHSGAVGYPLEINGKEEETAYVVDMQ
jgi:hypothetical protein